MPGGDMVCAEVRAESGVGEACVPWCTSDAQCGTDLVCDRVTGLCEHPTDPSIGGPCATAEDCGSGLVCLGETPIDDQVVPGGYCSRDCVQDGDCSALGPGAECLVVSTGRAYCFAACTQGATTGGPKCHDRTDVACTFVGFASFCLPRCANHDQCGDDRYCERGDGWCAATDVSRERDAVGSPCDPSADTCAGVCHPFRELCVEPCRIGTPEEGLRTCGASDAFRAACFDVTERLGVGDMHECQRLCDVDAECEGGQVCEPSTHAEVYGARGRCAEPLGSVEPAPTRCAPGEERACRGPGECLGREACRAAAGASADPEFGVCVCGEGGAGGSPEDSGGSSDGGADGGGASEPRAGSEGCGCRLANSAPTPWGAVWIVALLVARRARRRGRSPRN